MNNCDTCVWATRNGGCASWGCDYIPMKEAAEAWKERKVGKWKYETMRHIITGEMRTVRICSECGGGWFRYDLSDGVEDSEPNYCPNCGARMEGDGDEAD